MRQSKTVDGVTTSFVLDGMYVAAETSGETSTCYSRGVNLISRSTGESKDYYYMNSHGDVTKLVNSSGAVVQDYTYDAFGNQTSETEDSNPFRYAGEYWDSESGLIYLRARYYDSDVGAFVSEDPARDGLNWYVYCGGNPVNRWDPSGMWAVDGSDANLPAWAQNEIAWLSSVWLNGNATDKEWAHKEANSIRNRVKATWYAFSYAYDETDHDGYHYYSGDEGSDCANFISQSLSAGGFEQNQYWYWGSYSTGGIRGMLGKSTTDASASWLRAPDLYRYMDENNNAWGAGNAAYITNAGDVKNVSGILPGDLIGFCGDDGIGHVGIVTDITQDGDILFSAHTTARQNQSLIKMYTEEGYDGTIYIMHLDYTKTVR